MLFSNSLYAAAKPSKKVKCHPDAVDLVMDLLQSRPANTGENEPITNFKPRISTGTLSHFLRRPIVLPRSNSMLRCVVRVVGVRCCTIAW